MRKPCPPLPVPSDMPERARGAHGWRGHPRSIPDRPATPEPSHSSPVFELDLLRSASRSRCRCSSASCSLKNGLLGLYKVVQVALWRYLRLLVHAVTSWCAKRCVASVEASALARRALPSSPRSSAAAARLAAVERPLRLPWSLLPPLPCAGRQDYESSSYFAGQQLPCASQSARSAARALALV